MDTQHDALDQFVDKLLVEKRLPPMPDEVRFELHNDIKRRLEDQINQTLIAALPDDRTGGFEALVDDESTNEATLQQYMADSGIDIQKLTFDAMLRFGSAYLNRPLDLPENGN